MDITRFRLFHIEDERLESFDLDAHPPYLAASHTWSENVFPRGRSFSKCFAGKGMKAVVSQRHPGIKYCWFDTVCIDQEDERDKLEQIPLMDRIFGKAECVVVFISSHIGATQRDVDWLTVKLDGALAMCKEEAWKEEGDYWQSTEGRKWLELGMQCLLRLASTAWASRIWTLQEYVLATSILWIGLDLNPVQVDDYVISALPDICNTLTIQECLTPVFKVLGSHFAGMANARLRTIDRTRIMELPGNRHATVDVDEVYGCMAASGVSIKPISGETKGKAWGRWCEEAVRQGNVRWILLPVSPASLVEDERPSCVFPQFSNRHETSGSSGLDDIDPLGRTSVFKGCVTTAARLVGSARIIRRLGKVHEPESGSIHRDITLVLFAGGNWSLALKLVWAFGGGRYNIRQARAIARVLIQSYARAVRVVACHREDSFQPFLSSHFQQSVWNDFMALQQSQMIAINVGEAYLCDISLSISGISRCLAVVVVGTTPPKSDLSVLDFEAKAPDGRSLLMLVQSAALPDGTPTLHKVGMTIGISDDIAKLWSSVPVQRMQLGGLGCSGCEPREMEPEHLPNGMDVQAKRLRGSRYSLNIRMMERHLERVRFKLFSQKSRHHLSRNRDRQLRHGLERGHARLSNLMQQSRW